MSIHVKVNFNTKFRENTLSRSRFVRCGKTDKHHFEANNYEGGCIIPLLLNCPACYGSFCGRDRQLAIDFSVLMTLYLIEPLKLSTKSSPSREVVL
jgi:hypothetical protein